MNQQHKKQLLAECSEVLRFKSEVEQSEYEKNKNDPNNDPYVQRIIELATDWGRLMQSKNSLDFETFAEDCFSVCDYDGATGNMYSWAANILSRIWIHGETFRQWFNLKHQIGNEGERANKNGGILNTAMLVIRDAS